MGQNVAGLQNPLALLESANGRETDLLDEAFDLSLLDYEKPDEVVLGLDSHIFLLLRGHLLEYCYFVLLGQQTFQLYIERLIFAILQRTLTVQRAELFYCHSVYINLCVVREQNKVLGALLDPEASDLQPTFGDKIFLLEEDAELVLFPALPEKPHEEGLLGLLVGQQQLEMAHRAVLDLVLPFHALEMVGVAAVGANKRIIGPHLLLTHAHPSLIDVAHVVCLIADVVDEFFGLGLQAGLFEVAVLLRAASFGVLGDLNLLLLRILSNVNHLRLVTLSLLDQPTDLLFQHPIELNPCIQSFETGPNGRVKLSSLLDDHISDLREGLIALSPDQRKRDHGIIQILIALLLHLDREDSQAKLLNKLEIYLHKGFPDHLDRLGHFSHNCGFQVASYSLDWRLSGSSNSGSFLQVPRQQL